MIALLRGELWERSLDHVIVSCGGVGYQAFCSLTTLSGLPDTGEVELRIHTHMNEGNITLFGFATEAERDTFKLLLGITGIGPRLALAILGGLRVEDLVGVIARGDVKRLQSVPGIGKKTAERVVLELRDKMGKIGNLAAGVATPLPAAGSVSGSASTLDEVRSALGNLGFKPVVVDRAVDAVRPLAVDGATVTELLREALKELRGG